MCHRIDFRSVFGAVLPMNSGKTVLAQVLAGLCSKEFSRCGARYLMLRDTPALSAYGHFATIVFVQLTYRQSLRDIEVCLNARRSLLYHAGIRDVRSQLPVAIMAVG